MAELSPARKRLAVLFVVVGLGVIVERAVALASGDGNEVPSVPGPAPVPAAVPGWSAQAPAPAASVAALHLERLTDRQGASAPERPASDADARTQALFAPRSWLPPPPPPEAPPEPVAPPFPYAYLGGLTDESGRSAFFEANGRLITLHAGDTVDGNWHVEKLDDKTMTLTYLPLKQQRVTALGVQR